MLSYRKQQDLEKDLNLKNQTRANPTAVIHINDLEW